MGSSSSSGTVSRSSSGSGGGLLGGATGAVGGVVNTTANTVGTVANTTRQTAGSAAGTVANTAGRTINGINISRPAGASAQGGTTLSAQSKNLRLEKGAAFQLQVNGSVSKN